LSAPGGLETIAGMAPRGSGPASVRRFFLARDLAGDGAPKLLPWEQEHALRVLRLGPGDRLIGLDGEGGAWPLEVRSVTKRELELVRAGPAEREPRPGEDGARLAWLEVAAAWPRGARAEELLDRLTQLGLSVFRPLESERTAPEARAAGASRRARLERIAAEACKQCGRTWLPRIEDEIALAELVARGGELLVLDPEAPERLSQWLARRAEVSRPGWTRERPLVIVAGPEGGFSASERRLLAESGASAGRVGVHVLRIETALEVALGMVAENGC
jgi:16S rRNA (uracil1498-N3)-methyltransferase